MIHVRLPELSHFETAETACSIPFFVTMDQRIGTIFRFPPVDIESPQFSARFEELGRYISRLRPGLNLKIIAKAKPNPTQATAMECSGSKFDSRRAAISKLGWVETDLYLLIEAVPQARLTGNFRRLLSKFQPEISFLQQTADLNALLELGAEPIGEDGIRSFFPSRNSELAQTQHGIESGSAHIGILCLWRQGTAGLNPDSLGILREKLPAPYEIVVNLRKVPDVRSQYILNQKRAQKAASPDPLARLGFAKVQDAMEQTLLSGKSLVEIEWLLVLNRRSESELKEDVERCQRILAPLGDLMAEVYGAGPSLASTYPGTDPHYSFLEMDSIAPYYLPLWIRGERPSEDELPARSLALHRRDSSLYYFDLFRKGYDGANCVINGRRGKGKSVLANLISSGLLLDPEIRLIKVDVGGSYVKECELYCGRHVQFNLSEPSGLNPFSLLRDPEFAFKMEDAAIILAGLLSTLILETRETALSKELQSTVERSVLAYAERKPEKPSLQDFLVQSPDFPRRPILERFGPGGVFANVLKERSDSPSILSDRYVYFNFEKLQNAANEDFAQAVMSAVIATVNLEVLRAGDARRGAKNRVVFFADETPFFIQKNGRFFKLTTANFRKFGHGTVLIAQTTRDFVLPKEDGGSDYGILINSPIRFFYQVDDEEGAFAERFGLSSQQIAEIKNLGRTEEYREVFLQDELGGRVLRVAVTTEEYWRVTSSRADNEKLQALMNAVPGLKLEEAIRCLSIRS